MTCIKFWIARGRHSHKVGSLPMLYYVEKSASVTLLRCVSGATVQSRHQRNDSASDFMKLEVGLDHRSDLNRVSFADRFQVEAEQRAIEESAIMQAEDPEMKRRLQQRMSRHSQTMKPISFAGRGRGVKRGSTHRSHTTSSSDHSLDLDGTDSLGLSLSEMGDDEEDDGPKTILPHSLQS